jgi:hypothetical protein
MASKISHLRLCIDYDNTPQGQSGGSAIIDFQVVCQEKFRIFASAHFSANIGSGKVHIDAGPAPWQSMINDPSHPSPPQIVQTVLVPACTGFLSNYDPS